MLFRSKDRQLEIAGLAKNAAPGLEAEIAKIVKEFS